MSQLKMSVDIAVKMAPTSTENISEFMALLKEKLSGRSQYGPGLWNSPNRQSNDDAATHQNKL